LAILLFLCCLFHYLSVCLFVGLLHARLFDCLSACLFVYLSVCLLVCLSVRLSLCFFLFASLSVVRLSVFCIPVFVFFLFVCSSTCLLDWSVCIVPCLFPYLSFCLPVFKFFCFSVCLWSIGLFACLSVCVSVCCLFFCLSYSSQLFRRTNVGKLERKIGSYWARASRAVTTPNAVTASGGQCYKTFFNTSLTEGGNKLEC